MFIKFRTILPLLFLLLICVNNVESNDIYKVMYIDTFISEENYHIIIDNVNIFIILLLKKLNKNNVIIKDKIIDELYNKYSEKIDLSTNDIDYFIKLCDKKGDYKIFYIKVLLNDLLSTNDKSIICKDISWAINLRGNYITIDKLNLNYVDTND